MANELKCTGSEPSTKSTKGAKVNDPQEPKCEFDKVGGLGGFDTLLQNGGDGDEDGRTAGDGSSDGGSAPEPGMLLMFGAGLLALAAKLRRA